MSPNRPLPAYSTIARFDSDIAQIAGNNQRQHDLEWMIEWVLQHAPARFPVVMGDYRVWRTDNAIKDFPPTRVLYRYLEETNEVIAVAATVVPENEQDGPIRWSPPDPDIVDF